MNELGGYAFADLRVGMCATFTKTVTEADIVLFAAVRQTTTPSTPTRSSLQAPFSRAALPMECCRQA